MRILALCLFLAGCASSSTPTKIPPIEPISTSNRPIRPEPSFAAKRLGAEAGALDVKEVRFLSGDTEPGPLAHHELSEVPPEAKRVQVLAWADESYGHGDGKTAEARAKAICGQLAPLKCESYNMASKAGLFSRALFMRSARVKVAAAAAAPNEASRAIVLFFK